MKASKNNYIQLYVRQIAFVFILTGLAAFGLTDAAAQTQFSELTKLSYAAGNSTDFFGNALAIDGDTLIVGANEFDLSPSVPNTRNGAAFIYVRQPNGAWVLQQSLIPGAGSDNFKFGSCVGISGDTAIVGVPGGTPTEEAIYVYVRSGGAWQFQQRIVNSGRSFGRACAISGDTIIIQSFSDAATMGLAHIYVRSGSTWTQQAQLTTISGSVGFTVSNAVTIDGDTAAVGVLTDNNYRGSVQIFTRNGTTWTAQQRVTASDGLSGNQFGTSVSVSGDTIVAGAPFANAPDAFGGGAAYVFVRNGGVWSEQQKLIGGDGRPQAQFGTSVAVEGNTVVVGSIRNNPFNGFEGGAGYVFQRSGTVWTQTQRLFPADNHGDRFGWSADISGSNIIIGAIQDNLGLNTEQGSAYIFTANPSTCTYSLSPTRSGLFPASGGAGSFNVTTQTGCAWQATIQDRIGWVSTASAGTGSGTINFNVAANSGKPRRATITINGQQVYYINQAAGQASQAGDFDQTFFNAGFSANKFFQYNSTRGVKVQPDGKIVIVGSSFDNAGDAAQVLRYNTDGSLDTTFDGDGIVTTMIDVLSSFTDVVIQPDGKIVAAGNATPVNGDQYFAVVRYNANGSLDATFGTGGIVRTDFDSTSEGASAVGLTSDGKIVVAGTTLNNSFAFARYNANGTLDTTFDGDGKVTFSGFFFGLSDAAVQPDGKIVGIANGNGTVFLRINTNGSLDSTFGTGGKVEIPNSTLTQGRTVAVQPDGKILGAGTSGSTIAITRLNPNGTLDTTFAGDGTANETTLATPGDIALQSNGKIVVAGSTVYSSQVYETDAIVVRFNTDGLPDTTFGGGDGKFITNEDQTFQDAYEQGNAVAVAPDGKIVVAGDYRFRGVGQQNIMVLRLLGEAATTARAKFDFDGDGKSDISVFRPSNGVWYLNRSSAGFTGFAFGVSTDLITPADYDGDGRTDIAVFRDGNWYYMKSSDNSFAGIGFGQAGDLPRPGDFDGDGKADFNVFRPSNGAWYRLNSSNGSFSGAIFGQNGDKPLLADFDGDGRNDIAVFRPANGTFYWTNSSTGGFQASVFGLGTDIPTPADFDGDGKTDIAVFRPSNGAWYRFNSSTGGFYGIGFGQSGDVPVAADYDGDGKADVAVFRPAANAWYRLNSSNGSFSGESFGAATDQPIPAAYQ